MTRDEYIKRMDAWQPGCPKHSINRNDVQIIDLNKASDNVYEVISSTSILNERTDDKTHKPKSR